MTVLVPARRSRLLLCVLCFLCFLSFPAVSSAPEPALLRFAVIGDSGTGDQYQYQIARQMLAWRDRLPYDLVLMLGDNIYGGTVNQGGGNKKDFEEKFDLPYAELRRRGVVFRATLGNHDMQTRDGRDLVESYDRFHIERPEGYYNFTASELPDGAPLVEFFVLNTVRLEKDRRDPAQLAWLDRALTASRARWRILYGHHPLYSTGKRHGGDPELRAKLEPLLVDAEGRPRVHIVLAGHDHIYERLEPQRGVAYFVCGASGQLRVGNARHTGLVRAVEDHQRVFMLWEATPEELRFYAVNERGEAFDCGMLRTSGSVAPATCPALAAR